jgi:hypothetical protein
MIIGRVKVNTVPLHAKWAQRGGWGGGQPQPLYPGKTDPVPLAQEARGPCFWSGWLGKSHTHSGSNL